MKLEIAAPEPIELSYLGNVYQVARPKVTFLRVFTKRLKESKRDDSGEDSVGIMWDFCVQVGVPMEVLEQWTLKEMSQLFSWFANEAGEEKKS